MKALTTNIATWKWNALLINCASLGVNAAGTPGQRSPDFSLRGQMVNILGFAGEEPKWRLLCGNLLNRLKRNHVQT